MVLALPPGKTQFFYANGQPLAGGLVYHYIPATTTPKTTWSEYTGTTPNANPLTLDSAGCAVIFGDGTYRQIVTDSLGNQIWDQVTQVATLTTLGGVAKAGDTMTGRLTVPGLTSTGGTPQTITPIGNPALLAFNPASMTTGSASQNELGFSVNLTSNKGQGASVAASLNKVAGYFAVEAQAGSGNVWALNTVTVVDSGANALGGVYSNELDVINNTGTDYGNTVGVSGMAQPAIFGAIVSGISGNKATAAYVVQGTLTDLVSPMWNRGFVVSLASQVAFADYSTAGTSIDLRGTHTGYGVDFFNGTFTSGAIRLCNDAITAGSGRIVARKADNSADMTVISAIASSNITVGHPGSTINPYVKIAATTGMAPENDNAQTCGANGARWSAVWAANGTIQTSDPTLKTDITPVAWRSVGAIVDAIKPISFRWIDGGGGVPGKRQHWGWNAEQVGEVFAKHGEDFGGFIIDPDGMRHLRPDQLLPVLWAEVQSLRQRVAALEVKT